MTISTKPKKIILVDDDEEDMLLFTEALAEIDYQITVTVVSKGVLLMNLLETMDILPDIIFLDMNMPLKSGLQCLKEIKTAGNLKHIKTIMLSTSSQPKQIEESYRQGAHRYVTKPTSFTAFKSLLAECMRTDDDVKSDQSSNQYQ